MRQSSHSPLGSPKGGRHHSHVYCFPLASRTPKGTNVPCVKLPCLWKCIIIVWGVTIYQDEVWTQELTLNRRGVRVLCARKGRVLNLRAPSSIIQVHIVFPLPLSAMMFFNNSTTFTVHLSLSDDWKGRVSTKRPTEALFSSRSWRSQRGGMDHSYKNPRCFSDTCYVPGAFVHVTHSAFSNPTL